MIFTHRNSILISALAVALLLAAPLSHAAAQDAPPAQSELRGMFYNQRTKTGGPALVTLQADGDMLQGTMNITGFPGAQQTHCGAGSFSASRATMPFTFTFVSQDEDTGCGYDWGAEFTVTASLDGELSHLWGNSSVKNAGRSRVAPATGLFEVWAPGAAPPVHTYTGTFRNETRGLDGLLSLTLTEGTQLISGSIAFDNRPGEQKLCGGGPFVGTAGQPLVFTAAGRDKEPGCGLPATFEITATPSPDRSSVTGTFRVGREAGTFSVERASPAAEPQATLEPTTTTAPTRTAAPTRVAPARTPSTVRRSPAPTDLSAMFGLLAMVLATGALYTLIARLLAPRMRAPAQAQPSQAPPAAQQRPAAPGSPPQGGSALPYARIPQLLTPAERSFYEALLQATPRHLAVFPQVRLANLVRTTARHPRQQKFDFYRIQAKCVDFVLCDATSTTPRLVVELDDSSHQQQHRQERDAFVDAVLAAAGLPILHVRWQPRYDPARLAEQIRLVLGESTAPAAPAAAGQQPSTAAPASGVAPAPPSVAAPPWEPRYACGQCHREVRRDAKYCPHCSAVLGERT